jgi:serine/threonine protein kinase
MDQRFEGRKANVEPPEPPPRSSSWPGLLHPPEKGAECGNICPLPRAFCSSSKLVHRDIEPSNIMVKVEEGGVVSAKIIDLGLAKALNEPGSHSAISTLGLFVGTPDFASPEQFAGVHVDIRSDLYSLGATLWMMLTGRPPFRGTSAELMYQHLHTPLAIGELDYVPQPVVVLLEALLEKDPMRRFQTPAEILKALPAIMGAIDARRRIASQSSRKTSSAASRAAIRKPRAGLGPEKSQSPDCQLQEAMFSVERRISHSSMPYGQTRM